MRRKAAGEARAWVSLFSLPSPRRAPLSPRTPHCLPDPIWLLLLRATACRMDMTAVPLNPRSCLPLVTALALTAAAPRGGGCRPHWG